MIEVDPEVIAVARERAEEDAEWSIGLLVEPAGDIRRAATAARRALGEVVAEYAPSADWDWDASLGGEPSVGEWGVARVATGVRLTVTECDEFAVVLPMLVKAMQREGIAGRLRVDEPALRTSLPHHADALICRFRLVGQRRGRDDEPWVHTWEPATAALRHAVEEATTWARQLRSSAQSLTVSGVSAIGVRRTEAVTDRMIESVGDYALTKLAVGDATRFRAVGCTDIGGVSLVTGGSTLTRDTWRTELAELRRFLFDHAQLMVYGYIRNGWSIGTALGSEDEFGDWPSRPDSRFATAGWTSKSFDDRFVPDAFGIQLLGPNHADRAPRTAAWQHTTAGLKRVLVEHVDPASWFDEPLWPLPPHPARFGESPSPTPSTPRILVDARADFAPLLFTQENLDHAGVQTRPPWNQPRGRP